MPETKFDQVLSTRTDPLDVLKSTAHVVQCARGVKIDHNSIERTADLLVQQNIAPPAWNYERHYHDGTERTINYLFLLDALNFSFWGKPRWTIDFHGNKLDGYWALAAALKRAVEHTPYIVEAEFMSRISPQEFSEIFKGHGKIPLLTDRWRNMRELGTGLRNHWNGQATGMIQSAERDAARLAQIVAENLSSFNDIASYDNHEVRFFKRAQIVVSDVWGSFGGKDLGAIENIESLTAFADYKLPQLLRAWGILKYAPSLARKVDAQIELTAGGPAEVEIRAATLWAVEFLRQAMSARGRKLWSIQIDWILWEASQARLYKMRPYHRVRTIYY
jgi:hypothetical protein